MIREGIERELAEALTRERMARAEAEAAGRRFSLLAELGRELTASLEPREMWRIIAEVLIPEVADYTVLDVFDEAGEIRRVAAVHRDPEQRAALRELQHRFPPRVGEAVGMSLVMRTGEPVLVPVVEDAHLVAAARDEHHLAVLRRLAPRSGIIVPLVAHGRVLGALAVTLTRDDWRYGPADLAFAEEVAQRAALALDNARLYAQAQEAARRLEADDRRKDEFLAMLAHELRNPLGAIANAGQVLDRRAGREPRTRELTAVIGRQVRHLSRLVDDLLDLSRISRGHIELKREPFALRRAVEGAVETARPHLEGRRHALAVSIPDDPLWIEADATRIEQVLANLLHNAAKFTPPGGRVEIAARADGGNAVVVVRDDGAGISPELLPRIFDLFVQEERSLDRSHGGLGIGLTLVRSLVERHGGSVAAASDGPGHGSEFTVRLPLIRPPQAELPEEPGPRRIGERPHLRIVPPSRRVLLVEDNLDAAEALGELLRIWGHAVEIAHDGASALELARRGRPDFVLLDIGLPGMDGYAVAERMRTLPGLEGVTLVAVTGYGQEADRRRAALSGFDQHLIKPVDLDRLRDLLGR